MPLTTASARLHATDDDANADAVLAIYIDGPMGRVAQVEGVLFPPGRDLDVGPIGLAVVRPISRWELAGCRARVHVDRISGRRLTLDFEIVLGFDDALGFARTWAGLALDANDRDFSVGLT
jgi:hypothetical protein